MRYINPRFTYLLTYLHTHTFNGPFSGTTQVSRYQKSKTNLDFTEARDSEWQWHQLGHTQVCISLQTDNHASTPLLNFLQARCPSCRPTNSVKALKASNIKATPHIKPPAKQPANNGRRRQKNQTSHALTQQITMTTALCMHSFVSVRRTGG